MTHAWDRYVEDHLEADNRRWLPDAYRRAVSNVRPVEPYLAALPAPAAAALAHWDRLARAGAIPDMFRFEEGGVYGVDFVANGNEAYDFGVDVAGDLWALGHEGGGNRYCVLPSGEVAVWNHETGEVEAHGRFSSLDTFAWAIVRVGAIEQSGLDRNSPEAAELLALYEDGCRILVASLVEWLDEDV